MTQEIGRRLVNGVWVTNVADETPGGGSLPDPSGEPDGDVLTVSSGAAVWSPGGGSIPDSAGQANSAVLALLPEPNSTAQPTFSEIDNTRALVQGWTAETAYGKDFYENDVVVLLKPAGSANLFAAELGNTTLTDTVEPDWSSAPNVGDSVSDGDVTWYNVGVYASWLATAPVEWEADTPFAAGTLVVPPVASANGHLYVVYPPGPYESSAEPSPWPTDGTYASGDVGGYLYDLGPKLSRQWTTTLQALTLEEDPRLNVPVLGLVVVLGNYALTFVNPAFNDPGGNGQLAAFAAVSDGSLDLVTEGRVGMSIDGGWVAVIPTLPTSDPNVLNQLWNDAGTLKVSDGP